MSSAPELLLDENLSWRVARGLRERGYAVVTTAEAGLTSQRDVDVFQHARSHRQVIVTRDDDFRTRFAPPHAGIIIVQAHSSARNAGILACLLVHLPDVLTRPLNDHIEIIACS